MQKILLTVKLSDVEVSGRARTEYRQLEELADSIEEREIGLIQPIVVSKNPSVDGPPYLLEVGGRRFRAHELMEREHIEAIYIDKVLTEQERLLIELEENTKRDNLTWQEEVALTKKIHLISGEIAAEAGERHTATKTAERRGKSVSAISEELELAEAMEKLPELKDIKSKREATKLLNAQKERAIKAELARRLERKQSDDGLDKVRADLRRAYIVRDFFQGVQDVPDGVIDFVDLDPPYAIDFKESTKDSPSSHDYIEDFVEFPREDYERLLAEICAQCYRVMKPNSWLICWHSITHHTITKEVLVKSGFEVKPGPLIWIKPGSGRTRVPSHNFKVDYETAFYARKGDAHLNQQGPSAVFSYAPGPVEKRIHPTEKPMLLMEDILNKFVGPGAKIMIPFLGGGNTLLAAAGLNMEAFGFEQAQSYKDSYSVRVEGWTPRKFVGRPKEKNEEVVTEIDGVTADDL